MIVAKFNQTNKIKVDPATVISEYLINDKTLSSAIAEINGRYPKNGFAVNEISKELVYVLSGNGKIVTKNMEISFSVGDVILVNPQEQYYWKGNFKIFMVNSPKFDPKLHKIII
jgi:mannose-6-phosphate isomerase-like protein (cupin superfamily)